MSGKRPKPFPHSTVSKTYARELRSRTVDRFCKNTIKLSLVFVILIAHSFVFAQNQSSEEKKFSVEELQSDLTFWRNRLETKHPLIYLYRTKAAVDHFFDSLNVGIDHPMAELEFFNHIAPVSSFLRDGHNTILPSETSLEEMRETKLLLPFDLEYFDDRLYVVRNLSDNLDIPQSAEITAINGVDVLEIRKELMRLVPQEGKNDQLAHAAVKDLFRFYYHIAYGFPDQIALTMRYSEEPILVNCRNLKEIRATRLLRYSDEEPRIPRGIYFDTITRGLRSSKSAILTISTFDQEAFKRSDQRFRKEIRTIFRQLKKSETENLIIDLRDNSGGNPDFVKCLLRRLFDHRFEQAKEFRIVQDPSAEDFAKRTKKKWYPGFGIGKFSPALNHFDGKLLVLCDENTFSAGVEVLSVLRKYDRATFLGTESGGNPVIMGGFIVKTRWKLPNTKLQFSSGTHCTLYEDFEKNTGRGIIPDIKVVPTLTDVLSGTDACLETALEILRKTEKRYFIQY